MNGEVIAKVDLGPHASGPAAIGARERHRASKGAARRCGETETATHQPARPGSKSCVRTSSPRARSWSQPTVWVSASRPPGSISSARTW